MSSSSAPTVRMDDFAPEADAEMPRTDVQDFAGEAVVLGKHSAADGVCVLTLGAADDGELPVWTPGSHVDLTIDGIPTRQYSLCGDLADRRHYRLGVLRSPQSRGTSLYVHDELQVGDQVHLSHPRNHFELIPSRRYVFMAGGIGITPVLPMLAQAEAAGAEWHLAYGGRNLASMAFRDELDRYGDKVGYFPEDETGLLDLPSIIGEPDGTTTIYCCGPAPLLDAVASQCSGWPSGALRMERFAPDAAEKSGPNTTFEVELARSGGTVQVPAGQSVLDALRGAGVRVDSSCSEGVCGTCEVSVVAGVPDHRDSVLDDDERGANDCMMICVSRSLSSRLVLDL